MLAAALGCLACPHCGGELSERGGGSVGCPAGHAFDVARQGYISLLGSRRPPGEGDSAAMVEARERFLGTGRLDPIAAALTELAAAAPLPDGAVLDLGAGTGHHLARVLDGLPGRPGLALELSKPALRRAARAHPRVLAVGCDVWGPLPVRDAAVALALCVFAPRNGPELARLLAPGGQLLVITPAPTHLEELIEPLGLLSVDPAKERRLARALPSELVPAGRSELSWTLSLRHAELDALVGMGPSAWHADPAQTRRRVTTLAEPVNATVALVASAFRRAATVPG